MSQSIAVLARGAPTQRAADKWESARFSSLFLALSFFWLPNRVHARPGASNANRWADINR